MCHPQMIEDSSCFDWLIETVIYLIVVVLGLATGDSPLQISSELSMLMHMPCAHSSVKQGPLLTVLPLITYNECTSSQEMLGQAILNSIGQAWGPKRQERDSNTMADGCPSSKPGQAPQLLFQQTSRLLWFEIMRVIVYENNRFTLQMLSAGVCPV